MQELAKGYHSPVGKPVYGLEAVFDEQGGRVEVRVRGAAKSV
jgi:hypothetical protein